MWKTGETILAEWPAQVVASHALVVAQLLADETVETELFVHLGAELLTISKLARLLTLRVNFVYEAQRCWREAARTFERCATEWARLPNDGEPVETHRRLLGQLCAMATDETEIYSLSHADRLRERH